VWTAASGPGGLEAAKSHLPGLILLDVMMPEMDGFEVCRQLKSDDRLRDIPVIFVTAAEAAADKAEGFRLGAVDYITKPFRVSEILSRVKAHMGIRAAQAALQAAHDELEERVRQRTAELESVNAELRASEEKYRTIFESQRDAIFIADLETIRLIGANRQASDLLGWSHDELIGMPVTSVHPPEMEAETMKLFNEFVERPGIGEREWYVIHKDGTIIPVGIIATHLIYEGRQAMMGLFRDITERKQTEKALYEAKVRTDLAMRAANIGHWDWDLLTNEVYFSPEWKRQLGYADDELPNRYDEWENLLHPDDHDQVMDALRQYLDGKTAEYAIEFRLRHKDGSYRWIFTRAETLSDKDAQLTRMLGCHVDITDQRHAAEALRESEEKFSKAFHASPTLMAISAADTGRFEDVNAAFAEALGYEPDEIIGRTWSELELLSGASQCPEMAKTIAAARRVRGSRETVWTKSGAQRQVLLSTDQIQLQNELHLLVVMDDITELIDSQESLTQSELRYRTLFEGGGDGIVVAHIESKRFTLANPAACSMFGYDPDEFLTRTFRDLNPDGELEHILSWVKEGASVPIGAGSMSVSHLMCCRKDGSNFLADARTRRMIIDGTMSHVVFFSDITIRKEAELQREQLIRADKLSSLGTLAAGMGHEINNPNTFIMLNASHLTEMWIEVAELLGQCTPTEAQTKMSRLGIDKFIEVGHQLIQGISKGSDRIAGTVTELKEYISRDEPDLNQEVDINVCAESAVALVSNRIKKATSCFETDYAPDLPRVTGSPRRIEQVIINLLVNACDALSKSDQRLVLATAHDQEKNQVILTVTDEGEGMSGEPAGQALVSPYRRELSATTMVL
jgi:PAS domain S-box-containing protein